MRKNIDIKKDGVGAGARPDLNHSSPGASGNVSGQVKNLRLGDLVRIEWFDASKGEARINKRAEPGVQFDIPVTSWGIFLGIVGQKTKHAVLLRDHFEMSEALGVYDVDFNVIPLGMIHEVKVLKNGELDHDVAALLQEAFLRARIRRRKGRVHLKVEQNQP